jgi:hypothetical protein
MRTRPDAGDRRALAILDEEAAVMEWVGLVIWAILLAIALPLAAAGSLTSPSLGLQSLFVVGGLVFCVLFVVIGDTRWLAWASAGLALAGAATIAVGSQRLLSDEPRTSSAGQAAEEHAATLAGAELTLLLTAAFAMILAAVGINTVA